MLKVRSDLEGALDVLKWRTLGWELKTSRVDRISTQLLQILDDGNRSRTEVDIGADGSSDTVLSVRSLG